MATAAPDAAAITRSRLALSIVVFRTWRTGMASSSALLRWSVHLHRSASRPASPLGAGGFTKSTQCVRRQLGSEWLKRGIPADGCIQLNGDLCCLGRNARSVLATHEPKKLLLLG